MKPGIASGDSACCLLLLASCPEDGSDTVLQNARPSPNCLVLKLIILCALFYFKMISKFFYFQVPAFPDFREFSEE
jgi:hypothetical protein